MLGEDPGTAPVGAGATRIGIVLQESAPEPDLTVRECLELYAGYYRPPRRRRDARAGRISRDQADDAGGARCRAASGAAWTSPSR